MCVDHRRSVAPRATPRRARAHSATWPGTSHKGEALSRAGHLILEAWERCPYDYRSVYVQQVDVGPDVFGERLRMLHVPPRPSLVVVQSSPQKIGATQLLHRLHGQTGLGATNA